MGVFASGGELIDIAVAIERNGLAFYESLLDSTQGLEARTAYKDLGDKEREHIGVFRNMLGSLKDDRLPEQYTVEYDHYLKALVDSSVFTDDRVAREMAQKVSSDAEAIQIGIYAEKDSILFYSELRELVRRADREVVDNIIKEERSHLRQLSDLRRALGK